MTPDERARMRHGERWAQRAELVIVGLAVLLVLLAIVVLAPADR